ADIRLTMQNGQVSLIARDATVRQILTEWAKVGQTKIVNVERIPGGPVTLELRNVSEQEALDVLLRSVAGYMTAPRAAEVANASVFDRIVVMPASAPPRAAGAAGPTPAPMFQQPGQFASQPQQPAGDDSDDEQPAPNVAGPGRPVFNPFAQPGMPNPQGGPPTYP